jgi:Protein of unknown function (DUF2628)
MRVYTVHIHPRGRDSGGLGDRDIVLVKEGFCWPALFFSVIWAIWNGLWIVALLFLLLQGALSFFFDVFLVGAPAQVALSVVLAIAIGFFANDLRRWALSRRGFRNAAVVAERGLVAAERRFFENSPGLTADLLP